jgi:hypothetical protein
MRVLPTFGVVPALNVMMKNAREGKQVPGLNYGFDRVLHGEQYTEVKRPLPTHAKLTHKYRVKDIFDKGKNALVVAAMTTYDEDGNEHGALSVLRGKRKTFGNLAGHVRGMEDVRSLAQWIADVAHWPKGYFWGHWRDLWTQVVAQKKGVGAALITG